MVMVDTTVVVTRDVNQLVLVTVAAVVLRWMGT